LIFSTDFRKELKYCFIEIRPVGAKLFRAEGRKDGQTDKHDKTNIRFSQRESA
jgi:hypothetical protein